MLESVLRFLGFGLCHQLPERSFFGGGVQVPVCARDTGIYLGFVLSAALIVALDRSRRSAELPRPAVLVLVSAFLVAMAWDGVTSYAGLRETTNAIRLLTGLMAGWALPAVIVPVLDGQLWRIPGHDRVLARPLDVFVWLGFLPVTFAAVWWVGPMLGIGYAVIVALAVIATFTLVNMVIVSLAPPLERRAERLSDAWPVATIALVLTLAEIAGTALLREWLVRLAG